MMKFHTTYRYNYVKRFSHIWARNSEEAWKIAALRGLNEQIVYDNSLIDSKEDKETAYQLLKSGKFVEAIPVMFEELFLCYRAGIYGYHDFYGPGCFLENTVSAILKLDIDEIYKAIEIFKIIQTVIPGYLMTVEDDNKKSSN